MSSKPWRWLVLSGLGLVWVALATAAAGGAAAEFTWFTWGDNGSGQLGRPEGPVALREAPAWNDVVAASAGAYHSLAVATDGSLWACGNNDAGRLGDGTTTTRRTPVQILPADVASAAAGAAHSLILKTDHSLWACGSNSFGQLGDGTTSERRTPVQVLAAGVAAVAAGANHSLILKTDGSLWACGDNTYGQLGDGSATARSTPVQILADSVAAVAAGANHSLALKTDGSLWAWGNNDYGQLGDGTVSDRRAPLQILTAEVAAVAAGGGHSLVIKTDGVLWTCGSNSAGQLGDGTTTHRRTFVPSPSTDVDSVSAGMNHTLIVKADGSLWACGENSDGQLGNGTSSDRRTPVRIVREGVRRAAAGGFHSLVVKADNSLWVCGNNLHGQRGDGTSSNRVAPVRILVNGVAAAAAGDKHSLVVKTDGTVWVCGDNGVGQLGDGTTADRLTPTQIAVTAAATAAAGGAHSLIVKSNGALLSCGRNASGQLGTGNRTDRLVPVQIYSSGVAAVAAGADHSLILNRNGSLWACGENSSGQLGSGGTGDSLVPLQILPSGVAAMAAGGAHTLVLKTDGSLWACGENSFGQLGDGTVSDRLRLVQVLPAGVAAVSAGDSHSLIVMTDGSLWACGRNTYGQLGDGTTTDRLTPVPVLADGVAAAGAGGDHSLIVKVDGSLWACGHNASGQLGDGTTTDRLEPVQVLAAEVAAVAAGGDHSLALATPTYTLTYLSGAHGAVTGNTTQTVTHASDGTPVTAVPDDGYHFGTWSDTSTANPRTDTNVRADRTVWAQFLINQYTLTYQAGPHGTIVGATPQTVAHGAAGAAVTAVPAAGFHFTQWSDGATANPRTDLAVTDHLTVSATFAAGLYTLSYQAGPEGSIAGPTPQAVAHGADGAAVTAVPAADHHFVEWSDGSRANPRTDLAVATDVTVTAQFAAGPYTLTYLAGPHGSLSGPAIQSQPHGGDGAPVTAVAATNYHFVQWSDGSTANPRTDLAVMSGVSVTAQFSIDTRTVTFLAGPHGSISGTAIQNVAVGGHTSLVTAVPDPGYLFSAWSDDSADRTRILFDVEEDTTLTARFVAAAVVAPSGTFLAVSGDADVAAGRGWWHLGGGYTAEVAGNPLTLNLVHDSKGVLGGTATYTAAGVAAPLTVKGTVKGTAGTAVATLTLKGADAGKRVMVALSLRLAVDPVARALTGPAKGSVRIDGVSSAVATTLSLALPTAMDGTWSLQLTLTPAGTALGGTALLTLANGADYAFTVKGKAAAPAVVLTLTPASSDAAAAGFRIATTALTLDGNWATLETFSGKGCGQTLKW